MNTEMRLRAAGAGDAEAIARLHVDVWRETYRDIAPPEAYAVLSALDLRIERWREMLASGDSHTLVVDMDGRIAAFGRCGAPGDPAFAGRGEIKHLFVGADYTRRGLGRSLMGGLARDLQRQGYDAVGLGVVEDNHRAVAFYRALGGAIAARYRDAGPVWRSKNVLMVWEDVSALAAC